MMHGQRNIKLKQRRFFWQCRRLPGRTHRNSTSINIYMREGPIKNTRWRKVQCTMCQEVHCLP